MRQVTVKCDRCKKEIPPRGGQYDTWFVGYTWKFSGSESYAYEEKRVEWCRDCVVDVIGVLKTDTPGVTPPPAEKPVSEKLEDLIREIARTAGV